MRGRLRGQKSHRLVSLRQYLTSCPSPVLLQDTIHPPVLPPPAPTISFPACVCPSHHRGKQTPLSLQQSSSAPPPLSSFPSPSRDQKTVLQGETCCASSGDD